ncbi:unnamed protein product, partial [Ascophyllum nodosum]
TSSEIGTKHLKKGLDRNTAASYITTASPRTSSADSNTLNYLLKREHEPSPIWKGRSTLASLSWALSSKGNNVME